MLFIEMELVDGEKVVGTQMISPAHISEVEELGSAVRLHMVSGNSYVVSGMSFGGVLNAIEGAKYLKISAAEPEAAKEVEGELVD